MRVQKDATKRVLGEGNIITGKIKELENHFKKIPREALRIWQKYA